MKTQFGADSNKRSVLSDIEIGFYILTPVGLKLPKNQLPHFSVEFFVEERTAKKVTCSWNGTTWNGCEASDEGLVTAFIEADSFDGEGKLIMLLELKTNNTGFSDDVKNDRIQIDTGIRMVTE